ncbi:helix-turn-helix transcriptional regulator [Nocardioides lacusdianchii]|uniref:helix-turn-helix transcriptional regulator n=1 Tax=Nocardioides lacusdianchii TaxID=2783664 RepID=UPI001CCD3909|nr:helix-turn-helix transcriptional regulator [Nocardioides lacusdianchii]
MTDLVLNVEEQRALRHLLVAIPCPGTPVPSVHVLEWLAVLVPADTLTAVFRDRARCAPQQTTIGRAAALADHDRLEIEFANGDDDVVRVTWVRHRTSFSERDRAMVRLIVPALARLVHERPAPTPVCLTTQERTVLGRVAAGATNAQIARDLGIAESTVRKHLEHTYRKLGVSGRLAAVARLQERDLPGLDLKERIARMV